jgi:hypothetical protein
MLCNAGDDELPSVSRHDGERPLFVSAHEFRAPRDVSCEDRGKTALGSCLGHGSGRVSLEGQGKAYGQDPTKYVEAHKPIWAAELVGA